MHRLLSSILKSTKEGPVPASRILQRCGRQESALRLSNKISTKVDVEEINFRRVSTARVGKLPVRRCGDQCPLTCHGSFGDGQAESAKTTD